MKILLIIFSFTFAINSFGQDLNQYEYVVIPEKFSFLKEADQYQLNSLTKFLFEKNGFEAFLEGEEELVSVSPDRCKGLYADVLSDSGMFRTKITVVLKDCRNREVLVSKEGVSREKEYKIAYHDALRKAFESIKFSNFPPAEVIVSGTPDLNNNPEINENRGNSAPPSKTVKGEKEISAEVGDVSNLNQETIPASERISERNYLREERHYIIQKNDKGFNIIHKGTSEPFASLIRSSVGNSFIYNSMTSKGIACFDSQGNLIIEILKEDGNSLETIIYRPEGQ